MNEAEGRRAILRAADAWKGTPYRSNGCIRGQGANCAMLCYGIFRDADVLNPQAREPKWYTPQFHVHMREERLLDRVQSYQLVEITESEVEAGDIVAYLTGQSHGHLGIIFSWPDKILHTTKAHGCQYAHGLQGQMHHCSRRFFSLWPPNHVECEPSRDNEHEAAGCPTSAQ